MPVGATLKPRHKTVFPEGRADRIVRLCGSICDETVFPVMDALLAMLLPVTRTDRPSGLFSRRQRDLRFCAHRHDADNRGTGFHHRDRPRCVHGRADPDHGGAGLPLRSAALPRLAPCDFRPNGWQARRDRIGDSNAPGTGFGGFGPSFSQHPHSAPTPAVASAPGTFPVGSGGSRFGNCRPPAMKQPSKAPLHKLALELSVFRRRLLAARAQASLAWVSLGSRSERSGRRGPLPG